MQKILAVDLDGTLFYPKRRRHLISKKNLDFLHDFIDAGNRVIFVTSRSRFFAQKTANRVDRPIDLICINGAQIVYNGQLILEKTIDQGEAFRLYQELEQYHLEPLTWIMDTKKHQNIMKVITKSWFVQTFFKLYYKLQGVYREPFLNDEKIFLEEVEKGSVYRLLLFFGLGRRKVTIAKDVNKYIRHTYSSIESSWIGTSVELAPKDCSKAIALKLIMEKDHLQHEQIYVIGDSGNDISMFLTFNEHSYCMDHSHRSVKKFAKHTIKRVHHLKATLLNKG